MESARLVLDYFRALVWPAVIVAFLMGYRPEVRDLLRNVSKIPTPMGSLEFATGQGNIRAPGSAPDVWFEILGVSLAGTDCINRAKKALAVNGFSNPHEGDITYGYTKSYVGAIWCGSRERVLVNVAGPYEGLRELWGSLVKAFMTGLPAPRT